MIMDENTRRVVSPELTRSSIHCLKRFIYSASNIPDDLPVLYIMFACNIFLGYKATSSLS